MALSPVELFDITPGDWSQFGPRIVSFEDQFHQKLRDDEKCLRGLVESDTSIVIGARCEETPLAAYLASDMLELFSEIPGIKSDPDFGCRDTLNPLPWRGNFNIGGSRPSFTKEHLN
jgi:hypothetical protein